MAAGTGPIVDRAVQLVDENGLAIDGNNPLAVQGILGGFPDPAKDKDAWVEGTSLVDPIAGAYDETLGADPTEDHVVGIRATVKRALHVNLRSGAVETGVAANPLSVQ